MIGLRLRQPGPLALVVNPFIVTGAIRHRPHLLGAKASEIPDVRHSAGIRIVPTGTPRWRQHPGFQQILDLAHGQVQVRRDVLLCWHAPEPAYVAL